MPREPGPREPGPREQGPREQGPREPGPREPGGGAAGRQAFDTSVAHSARVHDYWLGGRDNYPADRAAGDAVIAAYPGIIGSVRAGRAFLARVVRFLAAEAGIRQFLDLGTGIPAAGNTHEVARSVAPESRVVYVDRDPVVLAHARALLTTVADGSIDYLDADLRDPGPILEQAARTLDFSRPVAVMLIAVMHLIGDSDGPQGIVSSLMAAVPPGSYLALSQVASDIDAEQMAEAARRYNRLAHETQRHRSHAEVKRFFNGLELVEPGLVPVHEWRAGAGVEASSLSAMWGGVARKVPVRGLAVGAGDAGR
jgi:S-adenosyl methyltransferase